VLLEKGLALGTASDLARTRHIPPDLGAAAEVIVDRHIRRIDIAEVCGKPFFNVASRGPTTGMTR
jgi:diacylglycerol kinase (ATP)